MLGARMLAIGFVVLVIGTVEAGAQVNDRIVFVSTRPASEIHVMNADGTGRTAVTHRAPSGFSAVWSPDGARFAFNGFSGTSFGLWVMDRDGGNVRSLGFNRPEADGGPVPGPGLGSGRPSPGRLPWTRHLPCEPRRNRAQTPHPRRRRGLEPSLVARRRLDRLYSGGASLAHPHGRDRPSTPRPWRGCRLVAQREENRLQLSVATSIRCAPTGPTGAV